MRVLRFDQQTIDTLKALGFEIADDNESAKAETTVKIIRPADGRNEFWLFLNLPNGSTLNLFTQRRELVDALSGLRHERRDETDR